jgi:S1-C subfamily serine protease
MERGVAVVSRVPGFCSYRMLQDGDVLLAMETPGGKIEFSTNEQLIEAVTGARAGDTVTFEVLRQGRILNVSIRLDKKPLNLTTPAQIDEFSGRRADEAEELWQRDFAPLLAAQLG